MHRDHRLLILTTSIALLTSSAVFAAVVRVPADQPTIQEGIDAAVGQDTVLVAPGTYTGQGNRNIDFGGKNLVLLSEAGSESTTINCQGSSEDTCRAFVFKSGEDATCVINGFTITRGWAEHGGGILCEATGPTLTDLFIYGCHATYGGGVYCVDASPVVVGCRFQADTAAHGGAIFAKSSNLTLAHNEFRSNIARFTMIVYWPYPGDFGTGGGVHVTGGTAVVADNLFENNQAYSYAFYLYNGPGSYAWGGYGGAVYCSGADFEMSDNVVRGNTTYKLEGGWNVDGWGGGIYCHYSEVVMSGNIIDHNLSESGAAIFFSNSKSVQMSANTIVENDGEALYAFGSNLSLQRNLIAFNSGAAVAGTSDCHAAFFCCDVYGNGGDWVGPIAGQESWFNNVSVDPLFCPDDENYTLQETSPCLPGQSSCGQKIGAQDVGCVATDVGDDEQTILPATVELSQNYPNPFNPETRIEFVLPRGSAVNLTVYNLLGQPVSELFDGRLPAGSHRVVWDGRERSGQSVASGMYFYRLVTDQTTITRKMMLIK